jgi:hypothetical protein
VFRRHQSKKDRANNEADGNHDGNAARLRVLDLLLPVVVAVIALALSALSAEIKLSVSSAALAFVAVSAAVAAVVALVVNRYGGASPFQSLDATTLESLKLLQSGLIARDEDVAELERSIQCMQVWIVTPDLHKDIGEESFSDIVEHNVKRREICYTWIVPESCDGIGAKKRRLLSAYTEDERERLRFIELSDEQWHRLPYTNGDLAIYNPTFEPPLTPTTIYFEYPDEERALWIRVFPPVIDVWIDQIEEVIPEIRNGGGQK